jgi:hypothetical protein
MNGLKSIGEEVHERLEAERREQEAHLDAVKGHAAGRLAELDAKQRAEEAKLQAAAVERQKRMAEQKKAEARRAYLAAGGTADGFEAAYPGILERMTAANLAQQPRRRSTL